VGFVLGFWGQSPLRADSSIRSVQWGFAPAEGFQKVGIDAKVNPGLVKLGVSNPVSVEWEADTAAGPVHIELIQQDEMGRQVRRRWEAPQSPVRGALPTLLRANPFLTVRLVQTVGTTETVLAETTAFPNLVPAGRPLGLCLGTPPEGLIQGLAAEDSGPEAQKKGAKTGNRSKSSSGKQLADLAVLNALGDLPTDPAAYQSVDVFWVPTNSDSLGSKLFQAAPAQLKALAEWLARGGRLVLGASDDPKVLVQLHEAMNRAWGGPWIDAEPGTVETWPEPKRLDRLYRWLDTRKPFEAMQVSRLQTWKPGPSAMPTAVELPSDSQPQPIVPLLEAPAGQGAVLLCGFPLEGRPLSGWRGEGPFFRRTVQWTGAAQTSGSISGDEAVVQGDHFAAGLAQVLGQFPGVVLFSFGWILMAILGYMLLIGPVDYWLVDRKLKRPEWTWFTFPLTVLALALIIPSLVGATKGSDLRVNRIDLVEYDLSGGKAQARGASWIALFTPTEGKRTLEAMANREWLGVNQHGSATVLPWAGSVSGPLFFGGGSTSFIDLVPTEEGGLYPRGVAMRVNTDQSFQASWRANLDPDQPPVLLEARHPRANPSQLVGNLTNRLPVAIDSPVLAYKGRFYPLSQSLLPGETVFLDELKLGGGGQALDYWNQAGVLASGKVEATRPGSLARVAQSQVERHQLIKSLFLGDRRPTGDLGGWNLRWRVFSPWEEATSPRQSTTVFPRDEIILFGRTPLVLEDGSSGLKQGPTRFVLDGKSEFSGRVQKETYIVAILAVAPFATAAGDSGAKP